MFPPPIPNRENSVGGILRTEPPLPTREKNIYTYCSFYWLFLLPPFLLFPEGMSQINRMPLNSYFKLCFYGYPNQDNVNEKESM